MVAFTYPITDGNDRNILNLTDDFKRGLAPSSYQDTVGKAYHGGVKAYNESGAAFA